MACCDGQLWFIKVSVLCSIIAVFVTVKCIAAIDAMETALGSQMAVPLQVQFFLLFILHDVGEIWGQ